MKQIQINNTTVEAVKGDIVKQEIDAIVNAANSHLMGGGGVDGAIHAAGGPEIMADTDRRYPAGCLTGSAVASTAGRLKAKCVIHAVAPRYSSNPVCPELLYKAYYNSLIVAVRNDCTISSMEAAKKVSAAILKNDVAVTSDYLLPTTLPDGLLKSEEGELGIYIGIQGKSPFKATLRLVPRVLTLGIGCRRDTSKEHLISSIKKVLTDNSLDILAVGKIASIDVKKDEEGLLSCARELNAEMVFFTADELNSAEGDFDESAFVKNIVGTGNVCERSAVSAGGKLIVRKTALDGVTIAVAEEEWEIQF